jgi:hypothetical protein
MRPASCSGWPTSCTRQDDRTRRADPMVFFWWLFVLPIMHAIFTNFEDDLVDGGSPV